MNRSICLDEYHGAVLTNNFIRDANKLEWSKDETKIIYVAAVNSSQSRQLFDNGLSNEQIELSLQRTQHRQELGEGLLGVFQTGLFVYNIKDHVVQRVSMPESYFPTFPTFFGSIWSKKIQTVIRRANRFLQNRAKRFLFRNFALYESPLTDPFVH